MTGTAGRDAAKGRKILLLLGAAALWGAVWPGGGVLAQGQLAEGNPRLALPGSHLGQPIDHPVFVTGHAAMGGGFMHLSGDLGYGGALVFGPGSSVNICDGFAGWTTALVVQVDHLQVPDGGAQTRLGPRVCG